MNDIIEVPRSEQQLKTIGHISYFMHAVVAVGAVLPGVQASVLLLLIAFFLDMWKRDDARGTWQESHFSWRIRSVLWAGGAVPRHGAALAAVPRSRAGSPGRSSRSGSSTASRAAG